jgi:hypothetical protein
MREMHASITISVISCKHFENVSEDRLSDLICLSGSATRSIRTPPMTTSALPDRSSRRHQRSAIDALKQKLQFATRGFHARGTRGNRERDPVHPMVQALVQDPIAGMVVPENLRVCPAAIVEHVDGLAAWVGAELLSHDPRETIEGLGADSLVRWPRRSSQADASW